MSGVASIQYADFDPVKRVMKVHAASMSMRTKPCIPCQTAKRPCPETVADGRQCRIWLNEAQREIDRLRRGIADRPASSTPSVPEPCDGNGSKNAAPTTARSIRPIYAPPALGDVSDLPRRESPLPVPAVPAVHYFHITNLGTMLDALA